LVLGRIKAFEKELRADVIIVDGPAAGHASDLVRAPQQLKRAISSGPIGQQADEVLTMLADGARCKVMLITTPAMTPVAETIEIAEDLADSVGIVLAPLVVNKCEPSVPVLSTPPNNTGDAQAYEYVSQRFAAQSAALHVLSTSRNETQLRIQRRRLEGAELVSSLADDLAHELANMP
jgi:anion-transporting  ArsA/GET3 family ATPase